MDGASITINVFESDDISFSCNVTATNPVATSLNLTRPPANNVDFDAGTGTITITGAVAANAGVYTCTADNGETMPTDISFVLIVNNQPITATPTPTAGNVGEFIFSSLQQLR